MNYRLRLRCSFSFLLCLALVLLLNPQDTNAATQPPEGYCVGKIGNTFQNGCDVIYPDMISAADAAIQYANGYGFTDQNKPGFRWIESTYCGSFYGANSIRCYRKYTWTNLACSPYPCIIGPWDAGQNILPICPLLPGESTRALPSGSDLNKACPGAKITIVRGPSKSDGPGQSCKDPRFGAPIRPVSGRKSKAIDLGVSIGGVDLLITYDTGRQLFAMASGISAKEFGELPSFGALWFSNLHRKILLSSGVADLKVLRGDGSHSGFWTTGSSIQADPDNSDLLSAVGGGYVYQNARTGEVETYNSYGQIISLARPTGETLTFLYSTYANKRAPAPGYLLKVVDNTGRVLEFDYFLPTGGVATKDGLVSRLTAPDGRAIFFSYDGHRNLSAIAWPNGTSRQFLYENTDANWALTGEMDENASRWSTYQYNSSGQAVSTELANGVDRYSVSYGVPPKFVRNSVYDAPTKSSITSYELAAPSDIALNDRNGSSISLSAINSVGTPALSGKSQPAGSGCMASSSSATYDAAGNLASQDDFSGRRTCYSYDTKNREAVRVEGLSPSVACSTVTPVGAPLPSGARRVSTTWHPDWRLPIQIDEPVRRVTNIYHGQPDPFNGNIVASCTAAIAMPNGKALPLLCKTVKQALLPNGFVDSGVPGDVTQYSYDAAGRVVSIINASNQSVARSYYSDSVFSGGISENFDLYFDRVNLLLQGNGVNGVSSIEDAGTVPRTIAAVGNAQVSTGQSMFGGSSIVFDGAGDFLRVPSTPDLDLGSTYTIEYWVRPNSLSSNFGMIHRGLYSSTNSNWIGLAFSTRWIGTFLRVYFYGTTSSNEQKIDVPNALTANTWTHVAVVRDGTQGRVYINGVLSGSASGLNSPGESLEPLRIGVWDYSMGAEYLNGYMDDVRITKGVARYTANFTPPTAEFPNNGLILSPNDVGHTIGDLQSITNAAGHVTQFTQYDRAGRVRQMIDPKGVVTDISYTPRGWVSTVTTTAPGSSARVTSYTYDGVGQLTGVSHPDGTTLSYSYDAAHRLVGVTDAKGNSISYTLDNAGNKVSEEIKDPSGVLQRSISRSYDALNRVQQVTGAAQ